MFGKKVKKPSNLYLHFSIKNRCWRNFFRFLITFGKKMWEIIIFEWIFEYFFPNISAKKSPPLNLHLFFEKQMLNPNIDLHLFVHLFFEKQTLVFHYVCRSGVFIFKGLRFYFRFSYCLRRGLEVFWFFCKVFERLTWAKWIENVDISAPKACRKGDKVKISPWTSVHLCLPVRGFYF